MNSILFLFIANLIIWLGFGLFLFFLSRQQKKIETALEAMEKLNND